MTVAHITNLDLDLVVAVEDVGVEAIVISVITETFVTFVDVEEIEIVADGAMVAVLEVAVSEVETDSIDVLEAVLTTVSIVNVVQLIVRALLMAKKVRATERVHHQEVLMPRQTGTKK